MNPTNKVVSLLRKGGKVILGAHSLKATAKEKQRQVFKIVKDVPHTSYCFCSKENDIMLLQVHITYAIYVFCNVLVFPFL